MRSSFVLCLGLAVGFAPVALSQDGILDTVAGTGEQGFGGDGGMASQATFDTVVAVAVSPTDGSTVLVDAVSQTIRRIAADGTITTICGLAGSDGYAGDGGPATEALVQTPMDIGLDSSGNIYIADTINHVVRKIAAATGIITTYAGTGFGGYSGPNGLATEVQLNYPMGIAIDSADRLYIADAHNAVVRKVDAEGSLTQVAGTFEPDGTSSGDGGLATAAQLNVPCDVAVASDGTLYIAELAGNRVRKVAPDGIISTYVGTGAAGYSGDSGSAGAATLNFEPTYSNKLALDPNGNLLIADAGNSAVRRVDASCCIETFAGDGSAGYGGDGAWAFNGKLRLPYGVACRPNGDFTIADTFNFRLRQVNVGLDVPAGAGATASLGDEVSVTFEGVNTGVVISIDVRDPNDPAVPDNLQVNGQYLDFNVTSGTWVGDITVNVRYDSTGMTSEEELALDLLHYNGSAWVSVKVGQDADADVITGRVGSLSPFAVVRPPTSVPLVNFRRGDANQDGVHDLSDGVFTLLYLFAGRSTECPDALDANDDGELNITDAVYFLNWLFIGGIPIPPPGPDEAGLDPTADELGCISYNG